MVLLDARLPYFTSQLGHQLVYLLVSSDLRLFKPRYFPLGERKGEVGNSLVQQIGRVEMGSIGEGVVGIMVIIEPLTVRRSVIEQDIHEE